MVVQVGQCRHHQSLWPFPAGNTHSLLFYTPMRLYDLVTQVTPTGLCYDIRVVVC